MPKSNVVLPQLPPARFVTVGNYEIAYFVVGPQKGPPLVLCHGLGASGLQFVDDAKFFAEKGYQVIVPDLRAHGRSISPDERQDDEFTIAQLAADLIAILDAEGVTQTDWVGNSLGGIVALDIMARYPGRLKKFASFGTAYSLKTPSFTVPLMRFFYRLLGRELLARIGAPSTCKSSEARAIIYAMLRKMDMDATLRLVKHIGAYDLIENGYRFSNPILMIRGALDKAVNRALGPTLKRMQTRENFTRIDLDGVGHCANLDNPELVRETLLDFLKALPTQTTEGENAKTPVGQQ